MGDEGLTGSEGGEAEMRSVVFCLIPRELAGKLHELLRDHFRDDPGVEVVVERRHGERRSGEGRRKREGEGPRGAERRRIRNATGRRVGERRVALVEAEPPPLPRRARRYADRIGFVERHEPVAERDEDLDTARLVTRFQAGDRDVFATLYTRYFDRIYGYLKVALNDPHEGEDAASQVFMKAFEALDDYEQRRRPFRAWLFVIARNVAVSHLRKQSRSVVMDPSRISEKSEAASGEEGLETLESLGWITDPDLLLFVERLPQSQRQVLALRYMLDLPAAEVARILHRSENEVRMLQHRAQRFLHDRLTALGRAPGHVRRSKSRAHRRQAIVVRERRFILGP